MVYVVSSGALKAISGSAEGRRTRRRKPQNEEARDNRRPGVTIEFLAGSQSQVELGWKKKSQRER